MHEVCTKSKKRASQSDRSIFEISQLERTTLRPQTPEKWRHHRRGPRADRVLGVSTVFGAVLYRIVHIFVYNLCSGIYVFFFITRLHIFPTSVQLDFQKINLENFL